MSDPMRDYYRQFNDFLDEMFDSIVEKRTPRLASAIEAEGEDAPAASCGARERGPEGETPR